MVPRRSLALALALAPLGLASAQAPGVTPNGTAQAARPQVTRKPLPYIRIDASCSALGWLDDGRLVIRVSEADDGVDLDGDGFLDDLVLQLFDPRTERIENLGISASYGVTGGNLVAFYRDETFEGDLNGDGDTADEVLFLYDAATDTITSSGLAVASTARVATRVSAGIVAFLVSEADQGQTDLDGNGVAIDWVVHLYDQAQDRFVNIELHQVLDPIFYVDGTGITFRSDGQLCHFDVATDVLTTTGVPVQEHLAGDGDSVFLKVYEPDAGADLNGDGDQLDGVLHHFRPSTGQLDNLGLALTSSTNQNRIFPVAVDEDRAYVFVDEQGQGQDLDGDGDALHSVLHEVDRATLAVTNTGVEAYFLSFSSGGFGNPYAWEGEVLFLRRESETVGDLNGDGDLLDRVLHRYTSSGAVVTNVGRAVDDYEPTLTVGPILSFTSDEEGVDLNQDGDGSDYVFFTYDMRTGALENQGLAYDDSSLNPDPAVSLRFQVFTVSEKDEGRDLNGDFDQVDEIKFYRDRATGRTINLRVAGSMRYDKRHPNGIPFSFHEFGAQFDVDGDGLLLDSITYLFFP